MSQGGTPFGNLGFLPPWCQHLFPRKLHFLSSYACIGLRAGSFSPLHFISKSKPYNKFTSEEICLFSKGQTHMLSKKCKLKQVPFFTYEIDKNESNYIAIIGKGVVKIGTSHRWEDKCLYAKYKDRFFVFLYKDHYLPMKPVTQPLGK